MTCPRSFEIRFPIQKIILTFLALASLRLVSERNGYSYRYQRKILRNLGDFDFSVSLEMTPSLHKKSRYPPHFTLFATFAKMSFIFDVSDFDGNGPDEATVAS